MVQVRKCEQNLDRTYMNTEVPAWEESKALEKSGLKCGTVHFSLSYRVPWGWKIRKTPGGQEYYVKPDRKATAFSEIATWKFPQGND